MSDDPVTTGEPLEVPADTPITTAAPSTQHESGSTTFSRNPEGEWTLERAQHELKVETTAHKQLVERAREEHTLQEEAKDRELIRRVVYGLSALVLAAFLYLGGLTLFADNDGEQEWAQESLIVLFTATVSAVGGWFANRKSD